VHEYFETVEREQSSRNLIYLDQPETVCGVRLNNVTPYLLGVLTAISSPFLGSGSFCITDIERFLWALSVDYGATDAKGRKRIIKHVSTLNPEKAAEECFEFMALTFMDASGGGKKEKPIAAAVSWLVYTFRQDPWNFDEQTTLHSPLRKLYQELRVHRKYNGGTVMNKSDAAKSDWAKLVNDWVHEDGISEDESDNRQREFDNLVEQKQAEVDLILGVTR